jgi:hypothetical protein
MVRLLALSPDLEVRLDVLWAMPLCTTFHPLEQYLDRKIRTLMLYFIIKIILFRPDGKEIENLKVSLNSP